MKKEIFKQIIADFIAKPLDKVLVRDINIPLDLPKIISVIGPRRSGKTWLLYQIVHELRKEIPAERLVFVNFEDDRLFPMALEDMDSMIKGYYELYPHNKDETVWFFLDEIQEIPNWEKFVRRLFDTENCRIYLTGSSSSLLSREIASSLRGRTIPYEMLPLSFKEFLRFTGKKADRHTSKGQAVLTHALKAYFKQGGFPELVFLPQSIHNRVVNEYIDLMLYRDLTERFSLKNPHLLKYLLKHIMVNLSKPLSINKLFNDMKSQGYKVSKNTLYDYIACLEEAFIIFRIDLWSHSVKQQTVNPSKVYGIDPAFKHAMSISEDTGRIFENLVFLEMRRRGQHPHFYQKGGEVDFYVEGHSLVNACYDMTNPTTRKRELRGLFVAMEEFNLPTGTILTWDEQAEIQENGKTVYVRPLWDWLLDE